MAEKVRLRRGTTAEHQSFVGAEGEMTVDTDKGVVVIHDGNTAGGIPQARSDSRRGYTLLEHFVNSGTYNKVGKEGLKRIEVHCYGGGGGGSSDTGGGSGGGSGGYGYVTLDVANISDTVAVTIGGGGSPTNSGGATYFGSYILSNGGNGGQNGNGNYPGADGGRSNGEGVIEMGSFAGGHGAYSATAQTNFGWMYGTGGGPGSSRGSARGVRGGAGGASNGSGAQGSVMIYEIYGEY